MSSALEEPNIAWQFGKYVMRSQLDCHDPRLPGTGIFDIKTRAALPIRLDLMNWEVNVLMDENESCLKALYFAGKLWLSYPSSPRDFGEF